MTCKADAKVQVDRKWGAAVRRLQWHLYLCQIEPQRRELAGYCRSITRSRALAQDLEQEVLLRGFKRVGQLCNGLDNPKAFLFRVASNLWTDWLRRQSRETTAQTEEWAVQSQPAEINIELEEGLKWVAATLPPSEYDAFVLRDMYEFTSVETANRLNRSVGAIKVACSRARRRLKNAVSDEL